MAILVALLMCSLEAPFLSSYYFSEEVLLCDSFHVDVLETMDSTIQDGSQGPLHPSTDVSMSLMEPAEIV